MDWTNDQKQAISMRKGNILVSAAAGSGKTAVLVERIFAMLTDPVDPVDIDELLVVTFTNAAAAQMRERVEERLAKCLEAHPDHEAAMAAMAGIHRAHIMTIHSFCLEVIRGFYHTIDLDPAFRIAEEGELSLMCRDVADELLEDSYAAQDPVFEDFAQTFAQGKSDRGLADLIINVYKNSRSRPWPDEWFEQALAAFLPDDPDAFESMPLVRFAMEDSQRTLSDALRLTEQALAQCDLEGGPAAYRPALLSDHAMLEALLRCSSLGALYEGMKILSWEALSRARMKDVSPALKDQVKSERSQVKDMVSRLKTAYFHTAPEKMMAQLKAMYPVMEKLVRLVQDFDERFAAMRMSRNVLSFSDLEQLALKILVLRDPDTKTVTRRPAALSLSKQFREILIDEYQDSNLVQETILKAVSREADGHPNIFMVGDVKQSIYKFRLARPELFVEKYNTYRTDGTGSYRRIDLHQNFRSRSVVLDAVNTLFRRIMGADLGKVAYDDAAALYPGAGFTEPPKEALIARSAEILLVTGTDDETSVRELEARAAALRIRELVNGPRPLMIQDKHSEAYRPAGYGDIVILLRTMSGWSDIFVRTLIDQGIPARADVQTGFFGAQEIQLVLGVLRILDNPRQDIPLASVMLCDMGGFTDEDLARIAGYGRAVMRGQETESEMLLIDACRMTADHLHPEIMEALYGREEAEILSDKVRAFLDRLNAWRDRVPLMTVREVIRMVLDETGFDRFAGAMPGGQRRLANLEMLLSRAADYEETSYRGLFNFIRYMERLQSYEIDYGEALVQEGAVDCVRIMSIHKSKGLEFPIVFVCGTGKIFNQQDAYEALILHPDDGFGPDCVDLKKRFRRPTLYKNVLGQRIRLENLAEEQRVLYVAMTRAQEQLILTGCVKEAGKAASGWAAGAALAGEETPMHLYVRTHAGSFLDWIMTGVGIFSDDGGLLGVRPPFALRLLEPEVIAADALQRQARLALTREKLAEWQNMEADHWNPEMAAALPELFEWTYPWQELITKKVKISVSELKHLYQMTPESDLSEKTAMPVDLPPDLLDMAALRGTVTHKILEQMDIAGIGSREDVLALTEDLAKRGLISREGAGLADPDGILAFARSNLARRMCLAQERGMLFREKQFVMGRPLEEDPEEMILIQGIIDAWFEEDGAAVIVDYKTDRVHSPRILTERYRVQLDTYAEAITQITGLPVKEKIIYSLALRQSILL